MSGHEPGRLGRCPICHKRFTNTDKDVDLYRLMLARHTGEQMAPQTIWWRIHRQCVENHPAACGQRLAGLYATPGGIGIVDESGSGDHERKGNTMTDRSGEQLPQRDRPAMSVDDWDGRPIRVTFKSGAILTGMAFTDRGRVGIRLDGNIALFVGSDDDTVGRAVASIEPLEVTSN